MAKDEEKTALATEKAPIEKETTSETSAVATQEAPKNYIYTNAEEKFNTRLGEHLIKVSKTVDKTDDINPTIRQTISHEFQGKKQDAQNITTTIEAYRASLGHKTEIRENNSISTYRDKNKTNLKMKVETTINRSDYAQDGSRNIVTGKTTPYSYKHENTTTTTYNKNGSVATEASHTEHFDKSASLQDSYIKYTDYEKGLIKQEFHTEATSAKLTIDTHTSKKNTHFHATLEGNGDAYYLKENHKKATTIRINDGHMSGMVHLLDGNNIVGKKELSKRKIKRELKSMRKEADNAITKISSAKTAEEYMAAIPAPSQVSRINFSDFFNDAQTEALVQKNITEVSAKQKQEFQEKATVSVDQILQQQITEIKQR